MNHENKSESEEKNLHSNQFQSIDSNLISNINSSDEMGVMLLFINLKSGSQEGKYFFEVAEREKNNEQHHLRKIEFTTSMNKKFEVYFFDILNQKDYEKGCFLLKSFINISKISLLII